MTLKKRKRKLEINSEKIWKKIALYRADNRCEKCGEIGVNVHHIIPKSRCRALRWDVDNALVLCPRDHTMGRVSAHSLNYLGQVEFHNWCNEYLGEHRLNYLKENEHKMFKSNLQNLQEENDKLNDL